VLTDPPSGHPGDRLIEHAQFPDLFVAAWGACVPDPLVEPDERPCSLPGGRLREGGGDLARCLRTRVFEAVAPACGEGERVARYARLPYGFLVLLVMGLGGALAGLAGAVEVLGVHYHYVASFSAVNDFDGLIVAFAGGLHPFGVILLSVLLGGLRSGAIVGLQIRSGIPRELGGALIALLLIFSAMHKFYRVNGRGERQELS